MVLGPTASGKTRLASYLAAQLDGEIISADSRQVYKQLDIGTGKDLGEYTVEGKIIPYHAINIVEPSEQFYLHQFVEVLKNSFDEISSKNKWPIICGGSGLYLDALHKDFSFTQIKEDFELRAALEHVSKPELVARLLTFPSELIAQVDQNSMKRLIRGIEIAKFRKANPDFIKTQTLPYKPFYLGIKTEKEERSKNIYQRLITRLDEGMIEEAESLLKNGISHERLQLFGLEYKFLSWFLQNKISREELITQLHLAIVQFSKRQMTWFRKMEKEGVRIHWIDASAEPLEVLGELKKALS